MAFHCEPCREVMTDPGWGLSYSRGPCECCGVVSLCLDNHHYQWSKRNSEISKAAHAEHPPKTGA